MQDAEEPQNQDLSPAAEWDRDIARRALDELFRLAGEYKTTKEYWELLKFVGRFRFYSPYNAMLIHTQMPGAHTLRRHTGGLINTTGESSQGHVRSSSSNRWAR